MTAREMMVEVEIKDFQSIEHVKFQIDGFTVLVGRSNLGKSSVVRAVQCALTAATGTDFVRHGLHCDRRNKGLKKCKCFASVRIKTAAIDLTWEKGDGVNRYMVLKDGEKETTVYDKVGQGTPDFLQPAFRPVKVGDSQELIQVSEQFSPIFLLDQSGVSVADVLSDVAQLDDINTAMNLVSKDRKAETATRRVREQDILSLNKSLETYKELDRVLSDVAQVRGHQNTLQEADSVLNRLDSFIVRARNLGSSLKALKVAVAPSIPNRDSLGAAVDRALQLKVFYDSLSSRATLFRRLKGVGEVELPDEASIRDVLNRVAQVNSWLQKVQDLESKMSQWERYRKQALPDISPLSTMAAHVDRMQGFLNRATKLGASQKQYQTALSTIETEEQTVLEEIQGLGICPTCSQSIEAKRCLHLEDR